MNTTILNDIDADVYLDSALENWTELGILLGLQIPSVCTSLYVLYHFSMQTRLRYEPANHVIILLLLTSLYVYI